MHIEPPVCKLAKSIFYIVFEKTMDYWPISN
jgi:hypothetical protein